MYTPRIFSVPNNKTSSNSSKSLSKQKKNSSKRKKEETLTSIHCELTPIFPLSTSLFLSIQEIPRCPSLTIYATFLYPPVALFSSFTDSRTETSGFLVFELEILGFAIWVARKRRWLLWSWSVDPPKVFCFPSLRSRKSKKLEFSMGLVWFSVC